MSIRPKDPLLTAARLVIGFFAIMAGIAIAAVTVAIPAMLLNQDRVLAVIHGKGVQVGSELFGAALVLLACLIAFMALVIWFLLLLRRIVDTVGEGDPFVPENADRLARMGWIAIGTQLLMIPAGAMALWFADIFKDVEDVQIDQDVGISGGAIVLILVLFILARVFRRGTEMRDDLEGTV